MKNSATARFDARIPLEQKELFEYAASMGGFRSLTDFMISAAQHHAITIIENQKIILKAKEDQELFFNAIANPGEPNKLLKELSDNHTIQVQRLKDAINNIASQ